MIMNIGKNISLSFIMLFALSGLSVAQDQSSQKAPQNPSTQGGAAFPPATHALNILSPEMRFDGKVVTGAPYSATATTVNSRTLANGAQITHKTTATIYRDSQGRTRREMTMDSIGPFATGEPAQLVFINDPVSGVHYILDQRKHIARKMVESPGQRPPRHQPLGKANENIKTDTLGKQTIEGLEVDGVRSVITIPVGQIGNDRPIEIVSERWESPDLQVVVMSKHNDPLSGENVYQLTNINRAEPAAGLFDVPSDYKVEEFRPRRRK